VLTPEQDAVIYAAIHADSVLDGFAKAGNDSEVAARLNSQTVTVHRRVNSDQLLRWAAKRGALSKLESEVANGTNGKREIAKIALKLFDRQNMVLELDDDIIGMLDTLVNGSVFTADDKADLMSRAAEQIGLAQSLVGQSVTIEDIGRILAVDRPGGKIPKEVIGGAA
jgi:hypothetical protein